MRNKAGFFLLFVAGLLLVSGCDNITDPDPQPDPTTPVNYELIWEDNFDSRSELDDTYWGYDLGYGNDGWGNDEWQNYTNSPENITVENGNMVISAIWDSINYSVPGKRDGSVTSARVKTQNKISFKYGKIQARIKAPTGTGMWPAFWMLGNSFETAGWPYCGEIDIMEISPLLHGDNTTMCTLHWWDDNAEAYSSNGTTYSLNEDLSDDYHIYEVEWDEQRIVGKIDDITYFVKIIDPITMNEFMQNFFLIFNVAVGGNLGGAPDDTTVWPQQMFVDWVKVYQDEEDLIPIETFGIFTDETPVDEALEIGVNSEIYVWESTLVGGSIPPFEGSNVISWSTNGVGWFGGGISSNMPVDLSGFEEGTLNFMMKIPANVTFKIGIIDAQGNENYVQFPANQTVYGLERNGEWGQAIIPVSELKGNVNLQMLTYEFAILEENGVSCEFAIDDIYYDGGGTIAGSVSFDADTYTVDDTSAEITVIDESAAGTTVSVSVDNGAETISIEIDLDMLGDGTGTLHFGPTNDDTDTIDITSTSTITASYTDTNGTIRTDSASIINNQGPTVAAPDPTQNAADVISIYSDSYTDIAGTNFNPGWGQTTIVTFENIGGNEMMKYDVFNYQGTELAGSQDLSGMDYMHVDMWTADATVVKVSPIDQSSGENLVSLTPITSGTWNSYDIPLGDFTGVSMSDIFQLKFDGQDGVTPSTIFLDNIYFYTGGGSNTMGIYSESHTDPMLSYSQIINSADWGANGASPDVQSTAVPPVDGTYVLGIEFTDLGGVWSGIAFDCSSDPQDISSYNTLILNMDTQMMPTLTQLGVKFEDNNGGQVEVNLSNYTAQSNGNWDKYEIPLSDFPTVNFAIIKYFLLVNPMNSSSELLFGNLYFDDIHLLN